MHRVFYNKLEEGEPVFGGYDLIKKKLIKNWFLRKGVKVLVDRAMEVSHVWP